jgi:hypothetical protein
MKGINRLPSEKTLPLAIAVKANWIHLFYFLHSYVSRKVIERPSELRHPPNGKADWEGQNRTVKESVKSILTITHELSLKSSFSRLQAPEIVVVVY